MALWVCIHDLKNAFASFSDLYLPQHYRNQVNFEP